jgi:hypothetical protein
MGGLTFGRPALWLRAFRRLGVLLAAPVVGLLVMILVLPAAAANAKELAVTGSPAPTSTRSAGTANLGHVLPQLVRPLLSASTPTPKTVAASYACDFSGYGTGIPSATMSATFAYPSSWPVNQPMNVGFSVNSVTLPSQVSGALTGVDSMTIAATVSEGNTTQKTIALSGPTSATLPNPPTMIPQTSVLDQVTFSAKGTVELDLPAPTIVVTPMAGNTAQPAITCTTQTAAKPEPVTVGTASGPFYNCVVTIGAGGAGNTETTSGLNDMTVTESGTKQVGKTVSVKLSSDNIASLIDVLAAELSQEAGVQVTKATVSAAMAVTGAQPGTLHPSATVTDLTAASFSTSKSLKLTKAGTTSVDIPATWRVDFFVKTTLVIDVACTLVTKPAPVGLALHVAQPSPAPSQSATSAAASASTAPGGTTDGNGTPVGAPDTGGGLAPGPDMPLALGALAILLTGGGLVTRGVARRRRRR